VRGRWGEQEGGRCGCGEVVRTWGWGREYLGRGGRKENRKGGGGVERDQTAGGRREWGRGGIFIVCVSVFLFNCCGLGIRTEFF